jgi:N-acetylneuraminic acid mutarotase
LSCSENFNGGYHVRVAYLSVFVRWFSVLASACALTACDSSGFSTSGNTTPTPTDYTISGTVSGVSANGLALTDNGVTLAVASGATSFAFPVGLASGTAYAVAILNVPVGMSCSVTNGAGTITANVNNIAVKCAASTTPPPPPVTVTLGGTISGLNVSGLVLANNGGTVSVNSGATTFAFTALVTAGTTYAVTVQTAPAGFTCSVANGTGTAGTANISNVVVTCSPMAFTVGGSIAGLTVSGLVLANGTDMLSVPSGATSFTMPKPVASTSGYAVTVATQPAGLSCSVQNGTNTVGTANVTNVAVTCSDKPYTLGGSITGLNGSGLVLANGTDTLTVPVNSTSFTLPTPVAFSSPYAVTVATQPNGLTCSISSGATGTMPASNVNTVVVVCSDKSYSLGGSITGLTTAGLVLANGTDTVSPPVNATSFTFTVPVAYTSGYAVSVSAQPTGLTCTVSLGTNTMPAANVTTVVVTCSPNAYTLGGSIAGLTSSGLVLTDGTDQLSVAPNATTFTMQSALAYTSAYTVSVMTQPVGQLCNVTAGTGTIPAGNVTSVQVTCSEWTWIGGYKIGTVPAITTVSYGVYGTLGTAAASNWPGARDSQMTWTDSSGKFWMFGGFGIDAMGRSGELNDMWSYDPTTQQWTWEAGSTAFDLGGAYVNEGTADPGAHPGGRHSGVTWVDGSGNFWLFGGVGFDGASSYQSLNDLWMYNPTSNLWTYENGPTTGGGAGVYGAEGTAANTNLPGSRAAASSWIDSTGRLWMFGGIFINTSTSGLSYYNDMWVYDPVLLQWTWMSGTNQFDQIGVSPTLGAAAVSNVPGGRFSAAAWQDSSGRFWLFGGGGYDLFTGGTNNANVLADLWEFDPIALTWTLAGGSPTGGSMGTYGTQGTPAPGNLPGARGGAIVWSDGTGQIWLFGGKGYGVTMSTGGNAILNDLWNYNPTTQQWTWVNGGQTSNNAASAVYGTMGVGATTNVPGARQAGSGWLDSKGHLWTFGGNGYDGSGPPGNIGDLNDLWKF